MLVAVAVLVFPAALMTLALGMDLLERRVTLENLSLRLDRALAHSDADDLETFVATGYAPAVEHYWSRRRRAVR